MRFYRVHRGEISDGDAGFEYHSSEEAAKRAAAHWKRVIPSEREPWAKVEPIDVTPTKAGILATLNRYASHPDNG